MHNVATKLFSKLCIVFSFRIIMYVCMYVKTSPKNYY